MPIRREDKEFIQALSLLGALFGACIGIILVMHLSDRAHQTYTEHTEYTQTQAALLKLKSTAVNPSNPIADENVLSQVEKQIEQKPAPEPVVKKSFWVDTPRIGHLGLCAGGGIIGAAAGYSSIWLLGWIGSVIVLYSIRVLYMMIRTVAPNAVAAKAAAKASEAQSRSVPYHRDEGRILPILVKLCFLLLVILSMLAAVVWKLTAI